MNLSIVRAWKDRWYRAGLSPEELAQLPENPIGAVELTNEDLGMIAGGQYTGSATPGSCCSEETVTDLRFCCEGGTRNGTNCCCSLGATCHHC